MGRKSIAKSRHNNQPKKQEWAAVLFPYFQEHGLSGITIDQMAIWLGKSKSTVYQYFSSKEEIIQLSLSLKLEELIEFQEIIEQEHLPYQSRYQGFLDFFAKHMSQISSRFLSDLRVEYPEIWQQVDQFLNHLLEVCKLFYQDAMDSGAFSQHNTALLSELDRHFIFEILMNPKFLKENAISMSQLTVEYLELRLYGLLKK